MLLSWRTFCPYLEHKWCPHHHSENTPAPSGGSRSASDIAAQIWVRCEVCNSDLDPDLRIVRPHWQMALASSIGATSNQRLEWCPRTAPLHYYERKLEEYLWVQSIVCQLRSALSRPSQTLYSWPTKHCTGELWAIEQVQVSQQTKARVTVSQCDELWFNDGLLVKCCKHETCESRKVWCVWWDHSISCDGDAEGVGLAGGVVCPYWVWQVGH